MAECQLCGMFTSRPIWCPDCQALAYCGTQHLIRSRDGHGGAECARMRLQMQASETLKNNGLDYSALLAAEAPDQAHICFLLEVLGVHGCGPYACLCKCEEQQCVSWHWFILLSIVMLHLHDKRDLYAVPSELPQASVLLPERRSQDSDAIGAGINSWPDFCLWRGLSLASPLPLLLTWPLTLWYSVERLLHLKEVSNDRQGSCAIGQRDILRVLVAGTAAVEVAQLAYLSELLHLWPAMKTILLALVGPGVARSEHGSVHVLGGDDNRSVVVTCFSGCAHEQMEGVMLFFQHPGHLPAQDSFSNQQFDDVDLPCSMTCGQPCRMRCEDGPCGAWPHIAFLPNAGLAAYSTWQATLQILTEAKVPIVASDYCEEALVRALSLLSVFKPKIHSNPFRSPLPQAQHGSRLPSYSNAFMCDTDENLLKHANSSLLSFHSMESMAQLQLV